MALTITVTKSRVELTPDIENGGIYYIYLNIKVTDGTTDVIIKDYSVRYRTGDSIPALYNKLFDMMQYDINKYKKEQVIYTSSQLDTVVTNLNNNLVS